MHSDVINIILINTINTIVSIILRLIGVKVHFLFYHLDSSVIDTKGEYCGDPKVFG